MKSVACLLVWALTVLPVSAQQNVAMRHRVPASSGGGLGLTYDWLAYNSVCTYTPCMHDTVASNDATNSTSGDRPTYSATSGPNSTPGLAFNGSSDTLNFATSISSSVTQYDVFFVFTTPSLASTQAFMGGPSGALDFDLTTAGKVIITISGTGTVATCTTAHSINTWYAYAVTFNTSTKGYACYILSGGTYTADGSGTASSGTLTGNLTNIGQQSTNYLHATVPEIGLATGTIWGSTQLTTIATYVHSTYGI